MFETLNERIRHDFTNHPPVDAAVVERFEILKDAAIVFGDELVRQCPQTRELSLALTNLEQALMYGRAAIARNQTMVYGRTPSRAPKAGN